jgi:hypothetical protein
LHSASTGDRRQEGPAHGGVGSTSEGAAARGRILFGWSWQLPWAVPRQVGQEKPDGGTRHGKGDMPRISNPTATSAASAATPGTELRIARIQSTSKPTLHKARTATMSRRC